MVLSLTSCDGLVEQPAFEQQEITDAFTGEEFKLEIKSYQCNISTFSLLVTSPNVGPIDYLNQDMFQISWIGEDNIELSDNIWLNCISSGSYKVYVLNLKTNKTASAEIELHDVF
jgi:hypothetical protein